MQGIIFEDNIDILAKTLKIYHTYAITNAPVGKLRDNYRFTPKFHQLVINARTPVEEIKIDGLSIRTLQFNFTPIAALSTIDDRGSTIGTTSIY